MNLSLLTLFALLAPLSFIMIAIRSNFKQETSIKLIKKGSLGVAFFTIILAVSFGFYVLQYGLLESAGLSFMGLGFSLRLDSLSIIMFIMIALLGFIVIKFSINYLDGDKRQGVFIGRLATTIASVLLLVLSGNLALLFIAWVCTSLSLNHLLIFYPDRPRAIIAAKKNFIVARIGDVSLLISFALIYNYFGTGNLEIIFQNIIKNDISSIQLEIAAVLIVITAIFKSAQFPTHGWLIEVMETPTPVSALLHAGLLNAGPFLIIRMAFIMDGTTYAPVVLIIFAGFTALFASVVYLTQTSIKTSLAFSSVAHMGFSLMMCGLGVYSAAMLHLVAHSFYKAHSFLSSGSVIDVVRSSKVELPKRLGSPFRIIGSILIAMFIYVCFALLWGIDPAEEFGILAAGSIIVMGLSIIIAPALDSSGPLIGTLRACLLAITVALAFFSLESGAHYLLSTQIPELTQPGILTMLLMGVILIVYTAVVIIQIVAPTVSSNSFWWKMGVHFRNGLYVNSIFDRMVKSLYHSPEKHKLTANK